MAQQLNLNWHQVLSRMEYEEFSRDNRIKPFTPKNARHKTFHLLKYGVRQGYKGSWGTELIFWDPITEFGSVYTTPDRAREIRDWIMTHLYP